jgi:hypothetical protein
VPLYVMCYFAVHNLIAVKASDRIESTLRNSNISCTCTNAIAVDTLLQNAINSGLNCMKSSMTSVISASTLLRSARRDNIPELTALAEDKMRWLASMVETCAHVYAICDDLLPAVKSVALDTFKKHSANKFVKLECSRCGPAQIHTRACEHRRCKLTFQMARQFDVCADRHINDDKLFVCHRIVNGTECMGVIKKIVRRVYMSNVPDSVIAELFRLSQE